jgi:rubrerythrin
MANIIVYRCRICGDPYIGIDAPARCPFCGAKKSYFIEAGDWNQNEFNIELSETTRKNLEAALQLELDNAAFYDCAKNASNKSGDVYGFSKFKALMKVEREHASAISKFLKISRPELEKLKCSSNSSINTKEGWDREHRAIESYKRFKNEATESRLKEFFGALVEIETDHLDLHADNLK